MEKAVFVKKYLVNTDCVMKQAELMSSNINPESLVYDFQPKMKPLMVAEDSGYGMNEKIMIDLSDSV